VYLIRSGLRDDICEARSAVANLRVHHTGIGLNLLNRIDVELRKCRAAQFWIASIESVGRKHRRRTALTVHRKLLREVGGAIGVGHGASRQQQQLAEVACIQRQTGDLFTGKMFATAGLRRCPDRVGRHGTQFLPYYRHCSAMVRTAPSVTTRGSGAFQTLPEIVAESSYVPPAISPKANLPFEADVAV
jgi:hypothetical protein